MLQNTDENGERSSEEIQGSQFLNHEESELEGRRYNHTSIIIIQDGGMNVLQHRSGTILERTQRIFLCTQNFFLSFLSLTRYISNKYVTRISI